MSSQHTNIAHSIFQGGKRAETSMTSSYLSLTCHFVKHNSPTTALCAFCLCRHNGYSFGEHIIPINCDAATVDNECKTSRKVPTYLTSNHTVLNFVINKTFAYLFHLFTSFAVEFCVVFMELNATARWRTS